MHKALVTTVTAAYFAVAVIATGTAVAAEGLKAPVQEWSFNGPFGTFDRPALRRGLQVYREVCSACHSLNLVAFRHLGGVGFRDEEVVAIASAYEVEDGPDDDGEMFTRAGKASDFFPSPFPNVQAARAANGGAAPPDLSLMTKARKSGPDYVYGLLTGYTDVPAGFKLMDGLYYNTYFPGHQIAMGPPLTDGSVEFPDGTQATVQKMSSDLVTFLAWAAEPELEARKRLGVKVLLFLLVLTGLMYALKRKIWSDLH